MCFLEIEIAKMISETLQNPGRKFITCKFYNRDSPSMPGCGFVMWVDEDTTEWQRNIINELLIENGRLKSEVRQTRKEIEEIAKQVDGEKLNELREQLVEMKKENKRIKIILA
ncbi:hypothetical protein RND81_06G055400 [Saponaria officinalis]|uniref:GRF-type domain-containing protein n=1 Tax=Saponaria officinalis TaxID=3572 RepID=A0AAW1K710_SAPOF